MASFQVRLASTAAEIQSLNSERITIEDLPATLELLLRAKPEKESTAELHKSLLASFQAHVPELLKRGQCLSLAIRLPLGRYGDVPMKRLLMQLARHLRQESALPPAELVLVPRLLQRLGLQDQTLMDEFCAACARAWHKMSAEELGALFRNTEYYGLLHATKGTALCRLVDALQATLESNPPSAVAIASLIQGALTAKGRETCRPILSEAAKILQEPQHDALVVLAAAAELHMALGLPAETLSSLLQRGCARLQELGQEPVNFGPLAKAAGRLHHEFSEAVVPFFKAVLQQAEAAGEGEKEEVLDSCKAAPSTLRSLVAGRLLAEPEAELGPAALAARLRLLHDLPLFAAANGNGEESRQLADLIKALLEQLLTNTQEADLECLASAFLAASNAAAGISASGGDPATWQELHVRLLGELKKHWPKISPTEVHTLFRASGDVAALAESISQSFKKLEDPFSIAAVMQAAAAAGRDDLVSSARFTMRKRIGSGSGLSPSLLSNLEAALQKGPLIALSRNQQHKGLLSSLRRKLFRAVVTSDVVWNRRPARGFFRYVEQCLERGRRSSEKVLKTEPLAAKDAEEEPSTELVETAQQSDLPYGIKWHPGLRAYEIRLLPEGRNQLVGYEKPEAVDYSKFAFPPTDEHTRRRNEEVIRQLEEEAKRLALARAEKRLHQAEQAAVRDFPYEERNRAYRAFRHSQGVRP